MLEKKKHFPGSSWLIGMWTIANSAKIKGGKRRHQVARRFRGGKEIVKRYWGECWLKRAT